MSLKKRVCLLVACDGCEAEYENGDFAPHFSSPTDDGLIDCLTDGLGGPYWQVRDGKLYCVSCIDSGRAPVPSWVADDDHPEQERTEEDRLREYLAAEAAREGLPRRVG